MAAKEAKDLSSIKEILTRVQLVHQTGNKRFCLNYLSKRNDSKFWKDFRKERHNLYKERPFLYNFIHNKGTVFDFSFQYGQVGFGIESFIQVGHGLGIVNIEKEKYLNNVKPDVLEYKKKMILAEQQSSMDHRQFLQRLKDGIRV